MAPTWGAMVCMAPSTKLSLNVRADTISEVTSQRMGNHQRPYAVHTCSLEWKMADGRIILLPWTLSIPLRERGCHQIHWFLSLLGKIERCHGPAQICWWCSQSSQKFQKDIQQTVQAKDHQNHPKTAWKVLATIDRSSQYPTSPTVGRQWSRPVNWEC